LLQHFENFRSRDQVREFAASQKSEERRAREEKKEQEESSQHKAHILLQPESQTVATAASIHSPPNKTPATNFLTLEIAISMTTVEEEKQQATRVFPGTAASGSAQPAFTDESRNRLRQKKRIGQTNKQNTKDRFQKPQKEKTQQTNKQTNKSSAPSLEKRQLTIDKTTTSTTTTRSVSVC